LAKAGARVTAIEENRQAIKDAEANLRLNRMDSAQVRFIAGKVEESLGGQRFDAVVLDPPRQGCPPRVLSAVFGQIRPRRAVYVSCNPDALAKELPVILKAGYRVVEAQAVDMFPHTNHIETVMTFERA
jgi:23S rRNA (uracil1939-C5)-methyltransferase